MNEEHGEDCKVVFLGHSIGGWVARSYIGEVLDKESVSRVRYIPIRPPHLCLGCAIRKFSTVLSPLSSEHNVCCLLRKIA